MIEEIRTYLLNSKAFSSVVYFPSEYNEIVLSTTFGQFRSALIGDSPSDTLDLKAWRANILVAAIYKDPQLSVLANSLFDNRIVPNKQIIPESLDAQSYALDFDVLMSKVNQVPGLLSIITDNEVTNAALGQAYFSFTRTHQRLLCLLLGYACSLKNR